ncbi:MAG: TMEM165/GDT1 family protein [Coriobacteriia bacterium]|nr:TMEM165/GDT1 family protein [Coriobacteriia bacterium]
MLTIYLIAALLVATAELGDKTQMLTLLLATRYRLWQVLLGVAAAVVGLQALAVLAGGAVGRLVPDSIMALLTGGLFIAFGVWTWLSAREEVEADTTHDAGRTTRFGPVAAVAGAFFLAELGDKTQILTMSIAADPSAAARTFAILGDGVTLPPAGPGTLVAVWLGSTTCMLLVNGLAALTGAALGHRLPRRLVARVSAVVFLLFGILTIALAVNGW